MHFRTLLMAGAAVAASAASLQAAELRGVVLDRASGEPLAARLYIVAADGTWYFARPAQPAGQAFEYRRARQPDSSENYTELSAHPFVAELPPGRYTVTAERGHEYLPDTQEVAVGNEPATVELRLTRWIEMAGHGWYSGDTHVHRPLEELPLAMLAEDLNVAFPITYWVHRAGDLPARDNLVGGRPPAPEAIRVDDTHLIWPINTEYEIFQVGGRQHTLGAVLIVGHRTPLELAVPPVAAIAPAAAAQGALIDLEKHNWPWSLMLVPVLHPGLFELANNHVWRTSFGFRDWYAELAPAYMQLDMPGGSFSEWGWIDFGLQTYYALLNCGFDIQPTAGTANGVHPVPLGFGRVYVQLDGPLDHESWLARLRQGRSFVSTGPMLLARCDGRPAGSRFRAMPGQRVRVAGEVYSSHKLERIELVHNGRVRRLAEPANAARRAGGYLSRFEVELALEGTSWLAVRAFEGREGGRWRFAHTSPFHIEVPDRPLRPRRAEVTYLIERMRQELARNERVLSEEALAEYRAALAAYERLLQRAE
jgi:hypothetical protein